MKISILKLMSINLLLYGLLSTAQAGPLAPMVYQANDLRASAWSLNNQASALEQQAQAIKLNDGIIPFYLIAHAQQLRQSATNLALASNSIALDTFEAGYLRPHYSIFP